MGLNINPRSWEVLLHGDRTAWEDFLGFHALQHHQFNVAIRAAGGVAFPVPPIGSSGPAEWLVGPPRDPDPLAFYPDAGWHSAHQLMHEGEASSLLIAAPSDFRSYELRDPEQFSSWAFLHAQEHVRLREALGI